MTVKYHCELCKNEITRNNRKWQRLLFTNMFKNIKRIIDWEQMREKIGVIHLLQIRTQLRQKLNNRLLKMTKIQKVFGRQMIILMNSEME